MVRHARENLPALPKIIFVGTPDFAVPSLKALVEYGHNVLAAVTQPDRPKGRHRRLISSPVKQAAAEYGLEVLQPEKASDRQFYEVIRAKDPDLLVVVAFGQILTKGLLDIPRWGVLNVHASLLPKYRGAAPIQWAILDNETKTGLTAMRMDEGLDTGPILLQEELAILPDETAGRLHDRLAGRSGEFLLRTLSWMAENPLEERPQNQAEASYAPKIDRSMSLIKWGQSAETISALIRGLDPWPGAFTRLGEREIRLFSSVVIDEDRVDGIPGKVAGHSGQGLQIETGRGIVEIRELQIPGKKRLPAGDFLRGFQLDKGIVLGG